MLVLVDDAAEEARQSAAAGNIFQPLSGSVIHQVEVGHEDHFVGGKVAVGKTKSAVMLAAKSGP